MDSQALGEGKATSETVCNASSCTAAILSVHVRFGSKADICGATRHVRFTPNSDIKCDTMECPLWANRGHAWFRTIRAPGIPPPPDKRGYSATREGAMADFKARRSQGVISREIIVINSLVAGSIFLTDDEAHIDPACTALRTPS